MSSGPSIDRLNARGVLSSSPDIAREQIRQNPGAAHWYSDSGTYYPAADQTSQSPAAPFTPGGGSLPWYIALPLLGAVAFGVYTLWYQPKKHAERIQEERTQRFIQDFQFAPETPQAREKRERREAATLELAVFIDKHFSYNVDGTRSSNAMSAFEEVARATNDPKLIESVKQNETQMRQLFMRYWITTSGGREISAQGIRTRTPEGTVAALNPRERSSIVAMISLYIVFMYKDFASNVRARRAVESKKQLNAVWNRMKGLEDEYRFATMGITAPARR